jgi:hypothetical protein
MTLPYAAVSRTPLLRLTRVLLHCGTLNSRTSKSCVGHLPGARWASWWAAGMAYTRTRPKACCMPLMQKDEGELSTV